MSLQTLRARAVLGSAVTTVIESLECRRLLTTIVVTSLSDNTTTDGQVTLREAIQAAETDKSVDGSNSGFGNDTITFDPSLTAGGDATITLSQFDTGLDPAEFGPTAFPIASNITIVGPSGNNGITIRRDTADTNLFRLFQVQTTGSLTLQNLTLSGGVAKGGNGGGGGAAGMGGAIFNAGTLTLDRCTLSGNTAIGGNGGIFDVSSTGEGPGGGGVGSDAADGNGGGPNGGTRRMPPTAAQSGGNGGGGGGSDSEDPGSGGFGGGGGDTDGNGSAGNGGFGGGGGGAIGSGFGGGGFGGFGGGAGSNFGDDPSSNSFHAPLTYGGGGAGMGGAIFNDSGGLTITNSTLSGNTVQGGNGGGFDAGAGNALGGGIFVFAGGTSIVNSTIAGNTATLATTGVLPTPGGVGIFLYGDGGTTSFKLDNSIVAVSHPFTATDFERFGAATFAGTNNLIQSVGGFVPDPGFVASSADPQLSALADNGGPTFTHLPSNTSPAVNAGDNAAATAAALATDQRGVSRIQGGVVDIGSVETNVQPNSTFSIASLSSPEGNSGSTPFNFTVTRGGDLSAPASVSYHTTDGTATAGSDYTSATGTLNFIANQAMATIPVAVSGDTAVEPDETFTVTLTSASPNTVITSATATGTITNDDAPASLSIGDVSLAEGDSGTTNFVFTVTRSGDLSGASSVNYSTANGSATAGTDYQSVSSTLNFIANQMSAMITVPVNGDVTYEPDETFTVNLSGATGATISDGVGVGTIENDDPAPLGSVAAADVSVAEGDAGQTPLVFTVTRSGNTSLAASVDYYTSNGTALANVDYQPVSGTLNFLPNQAMKLVTVQVNGDTTVEADETFFLNLGAPGNVTISDGQATGTITNDDVAPPPPPVQTATAVLGPDPAAPTKTALLITGTDNGETIEVDPGSSSSKLKVEINGVQVGPQFSTSAFGRIVIDAKGGDDHINVTSKTTHDTLILAGTGNDTVKGGGGNDVIVGGDGNDVLSGGKGRDLIIGGAGGDGITGDDDDDLLIGAATTYDTDLNGLAALEKEWISSNSYSKRVTNMQNGDSNTGGRKFNATTIIEDSAFDQLTGGSGNDLFFYHKGGNAGTSKDTLIGKSSSETAVDV